MILLLSQVVENLSLSTADIIHRIVFVILEKDLEEGANNSNRVACKLVYDVTSVDEVDVPAELGADYIIYY